MGIILLVRKVLNDMKVLFINSFNCGSTGNIVDDLAKHLTGKGDVPIVCFPSSRTNKNRFYEGQIFIGNRISRNIHIRMGQLIGVNGIFSFFSTLNFVKRIKKIKPEIIHLHNLHNSYVNLPILFNFIKKQGIPVVWTLHDCWAFTAYCPHFTIAKCYKWQTGCYSCNQYRKVFSESPYIDRSSTMWALKEKWFTSIKSGIIVTPSNWLASLVKLSFLKEYPIEVIHNGIDLSAFKPTKSNFREKYNISAKKKILLGVAFCWDERKGLDVFIELANRLDEERYQIVLVGTDDDVDKQLPGNIISIHRTQNQKELAEIYTVADVFVNPTREEVLGLVNIEALACGTPVITFESGGSPEVIDENCGIVVKNEDISLLVEHIQFICENRPFPKEMCIERAALFSSLNMCENYYEIYRKLLDKFDN